MYGEGKGDPAKRGFWVYMMWRVSNAAFLPVLILTMLPGDSLADALGIAGYSGINNGKTCSVCHHGGDGVRVELQGPNNVQPGETAAFSVTLRAGKSDVVGFNIAASGGALAAAGPETQFLDGELTHTGTTPTAIESGKAKISFNWTAPRLRGEYTIAAAGLVSRHGESRSDHAGHGDLVITVGESEPLFKLPPAASAGGPYRGRVGTNVMLDGTQSRDSDGTLKSFYWDFGDGNASKGGGKTQHIYREPGTYVVTLTVTDNDGLTAMAAAAVEITAPAGHLRPPVAIAGGPYKVAIGEAVYLDSSASSDPDGVIVSYFWEFGDGFTGVGRKVAHTYAKPGTYLPQLTVTDNDGLPTSTTALVNVFRGLEPTIESLYAIPRVVLATPLDEQLHYLVISAQLLGEFQGTEGTQVCGTAVIERNDAPYATAPICFQVTGKRIAVINYPVTISAEDMPAVQWRVHIALDTGEITEPEEKTTNVSVLAQ